MKAYPKIFSWWWTGKPGMLESMGLQRVRHDQATELNWRNINQSVLLFFFLLYNIVLVLPYINMHPPWVYTCSPSWTPLPPPSPYHPSWSSQCTSPKLPYPASKGLQSPSDSSWQVGASCKWSLLCFERPSVFQRWPGLGLSYLASTMYRVSCLLCTCTLLQLNHPVLLRWVYSSTNQLRNVMLWSSS